MAIISHKNKFIFLKTRKTAGGAIESSLSRYCGEEDILMLSGDVSRFGRSREQNNGGGLPTARGAVSSLYWLRHGRPVRAFRHLANSGKNLMSTHASMEEMRDVVSTDVWGSYYKFCFERNPFDRLVSFYFWRTAQKSIDISFKKFAMSVFEGPVSLSIKYNSDGFSNLPFYYSSSSGGVAVDFVGRWENLAGDLERVCERVGVDWDGWIPRTKSNIRPRIYHWAEYYDHELEEAAERFFVEELRLFGYERPSEVRGRV